MYQQNARAILKTLSMIMQGTKAHSVNEYLNNAYELKEKVCQATSPLDFE